MNDKPLFGPHTLKDEYHAALRKGMKKLLIRIDVERQVLALAKSAPDTYIALAALAFDHGHAALLLGIRIAFPSGVEHLVYPDDDIPF